MLDIICAAGYSSVSVCEGFDLRVFETLQVRRQSLNHDVEHYSRRANRFTRVAPINDFT